MIHDGEGFVESSGGNNVLANSAFVLITVGQLTVAGETRCDVFSELLRASDNTA